MSDRKQLQLFGEERLKPKYFPPSELYIKADRLTLYLSARGDCPIPLEEDEEFWRLVKELNRELQNK